MPQYTQEQQELAQFRYDRMLSEGFACRCSAPGEYQVFRHPDGTTVEGGEINPVMFHSEWGTDRWHWDERIKGLWETDPNQPNRKKQSNVHPEIIKLANTSGAIDAIRQGLIRCGFELEFHKLNGLSSNSGDGEIDYDSEPDYELLSDDSSEAYDNASAEEIFDEIRDEAMRTLLANLWPVSEHPFEEIWKDLAEPLRTRTRDALDAAIAQWREDWEDNARENSPERYYPTNDGDMYDSLKAKLSTRALIELGEDGSVRGGEIRTLGGIAPMQFLKASTDLLERNDFSVDSGCSFHIHLSVPGVQHRYGANLQAEMTAYLLDNFRRFPESVQKRLKSQSCQQWAAMKLSTDKYTAVHYHSQGTWEFRLFGNVSQAADARMCLMLAIEALRHAYRVKLRLAEPIVKTLQERIFHEAAQAAARQGDYFTVRAKASRGREQQAA